MTGPADPSTRSSLPEEAPPRMWLRVYRRGANGESVEILPRMDVADAADLGVAAYSVRFPPCRCPAHRGQSERVEDHPAGSGGPEHKSASARTNQ